MRNQVPVFTHNRPAIYDAVDAALDYAYAKHGREQWGRHEFWAITAEEFNKEVWDAICEDAPQDELRKEIVQVIAMCVRYLETGDRYREPNKQ